MKIKRKVPLFAVLISLHSHAYAEIVVVASANSKVSSASIEELQKVYLGKSRVLSAGQEVVPLDQSDSTIRNDFNRIYLKKDQAQIASYWAKMVFTNQGKPPTQLGGDSEVKKSLLSNPNSIGYINNSAVDSSVKVIKVEP